VNAGTQAVVADFEYGPFGEEIRASGEFADELTFRFSTKYEDSEIGYLYYGFRYDDADRGRWLNRDPIGEIGGRNLFGISGNNSLSKVDLFGLYARDFHFYVVYYLARAKCYSANEAYQLAGFSQYVDDNQQTSATEIWRRLVSPYPYYKTDDVTLSRMQTLFGRMEKLHFPGSTREAGTFPEAGDGVEWVRTSIANLDFDKRRTVAMAGASIHSYADSWGHQGFSAWSTRDVNGRSGLFGMIGGIFSFYIGHGSAWTDPDTPYKNPSEAMDASRHIFDALPSKCQNDCSEWEATKSDLASFFNLQQNQLGREVAMQALIQKRFSDSVGYDQDYFYTSSQLYLSYLNLPDTYDW